MFFKKTCPRCGKKISKSHNYCPYCGMDLRKKPRESFDDLDFSAIRMPFPFGNLFNKLTKELARELDKAWAFDEDGGRVKKGISISISNVDGVPRIKVGNTGRTVRGAGMPKEKQVKRVVRKISKEDIERYAKLPRKEAETNVKRLSNAIIYEISLPGVVDPKDVFINKLHNSIEIKAFGKNKAYFKLIPLDLNIKAYHFGSGKLILELRE